MVRSKYLYICDNCFDTEYTDTRSLPKMWTFVNLTNKFATGHGYTTSRTVVYHFCTEVCKNNFLENGPDVFELVDEGE